MQKYFLSLLVFGVAHIAFGWGSFTTFETHQYIDNQAYEVLKKDPALEGSGFSKISEIIDQEGVNVWDKKGFFKGNGPDSEGASDYSEHYYNPWIKQGDAPNSVQTHFTTIAEYLYGGGLSTNYAHEMSWSAHFLADMSVPYHILGAPRTLLHYYYDPQQENTFVKLPRDLTNDPELMSYHQTGTHGDQFKPEILVYLGETAKYLNWFDPWYWNGVAPTEVRESSHMHWEMLVFHRFGGFPYSLEGYSSNWKNPTATFDRPWLVTAKKLNQFTIEAAEQTRTHFSEWMDNATPARDQAIQHVLTLWRASITGLRIDYTSKIVNTAPEGKTIEIEATAKNAAGELAKNVQVRLTLLNLRNDKLCVIQSGEATWDLKNLDPSKTSDIHPKWVVVAPAQSVCSAKVEIIGTYDNTPDLQYNVINRRLEASSEIKQLALSFQFYFKYNLSGGTQYVGLHDDGVFESEKNSPLNIDNSGGAYFIFDGAHNQQKARFTIKMNYDGLFIDTVALKSDLTLPDRESNNFYVVRNLPARLVQPFASVPGLVFTVFYARSQELLQRLESKKTSSWSDGKEYNSATNTYVPVHYVTTFVDMLPQGERGFSEVVIIGTSIPWAEIEKMASDGRMNTELFNKEFGQLQAEILKLRRPEE